MTGKYRTFTTAAGALFIAFGLLLTLPAAGIMVNNPQNYVALTVGAIFWRTWVPGGFLKGGL